MANGGISPSGRALRFLLWRAPTGAARYAMARNMALATEEGRRWLILGGTLFWVWVIWQVAGWSGIQGFQEFAAFLWLLWWWRLFVNLRRTWAHRRNLKAMAVGTQRQRQMYEMQTQALSMIRQYARQAIPSGGTFTMMGSMRHHDPTDTEARRISAEQQRYARDILGDDQQGTPLGDRFEPIIRLPRFRRRKRGDQ